jgi:hypothetical protein
MMAKNRVVYWVVGIAIVIMALFLVQSVVATTGLIAQPRSAAAADADVARWVAVGQFYNPAQAGRDADVARWVAMGQYYNPAQAGRDADVARWVGLGEYYQKLNQP